ncbi:lipopolysaccharide assembly protein LapA domain-containing protein [Sphingopyxis yananensis]|uniref:lipopolysaccharide assembly protein LapA domain-containing protein n=1 Tax=Sphingopyxis yananensis TaxID=2886687 RepID=UPI001D107295|nr:LapA family protein [Sphingopyxis yananensis]MCC2600922.1 LapA family protein [Sphingopyxis yananensis]
MNMLRTIIWVLLTAILVIFAMANWSPVTVTVWPGQVLDTKLPLLILISFLIGSVPMWIALRTTRWTLNRRLNDSDRQLADLRAMAHRQAEANAAVAAAVAASPEPVPAPTTHLADDINPVAVPTRGDNVPPPPMEKL